jgi:predicted RNA binding protein YcfA (HicA-like mRNA interferase family)
MPATAAANPAASCDLVALLEPLGFRLDRVSGRHRIYRHPGVPRPFVLQAECGQAKPYQVSQLLEILEAFDLPGTGERTTEEIS